MKRKKIGLIVPHIVSNVDRQLLAGIFSVIKKHGHDLFVITSISSFSTEKQNDPYVKGIQNIFSVISSGKFDGFLYAADWFINRELKNKVYDYLIQSSTPVVVIEEKNEHFSSVFPEEKSDVKTLTDHLIKVHGCRLLYFLAGTEGHRASEERLEGFCQSLEENDISFDRSMVFCGDFWTEKPAQLGRDIASGKIKMPDAIVCASDIMALSLMESLSQNGVKTPDDIRITGNDGNLDGLLHIPSLTTVCGRNTATGIKAAEKILQLTGENFTETSAENCTIEYRASCGCCRSQIILNDDVLSEIRRPSLFYRDRYVAMTTDFIDRIVDSENAESLMYNAASFSYRLPNWKKLAVMLCEDWKFDFSDTSEFRTSGYSENLETALEIDRKSLSCDICKTKIRSENIIPASMSSGEPSVYLVTSLHSNGQIFGYICTSYNDTNDIFLDDNYCSWCDTLGRGLYETEKKIYQKYTREQLSTSFDTDPETGFLSQRGFFRNLPEILNKNKRYLIQVITWNELKTDNDFHFASMISVAIKRTASESEIISRISDNAFALLYPASDSEPDNHQFTVRLDEIENSLTLYNQTLLHIEMPELSYSASALCTDNTGEIEMIIAKNLESAQNYLDSEYRKKDYRCQFFDLRRSFKQRTDKIPSISELSAQLHLSRSHFQRLYSEIFGTSCLEDVISIRLDKAKQLLANSEMKISEIAFACGYDNANHFMRQFRLRTEMTASQFRKMSRQI